MHRENHGIEWTRPYSGGIAAWRVAPRCAACSPSGAGAKQGRPCSIQREADPRLGGCPSCPARGMAKLPIGPDPRSAWRDLAGSADSSRPGRPGIPRRLVAGSAPCQRARCAEPHGPRTIHHRGDSQVGGRASRSARQVAHVHFRPRSRSAGRNLAGCRGSPDSRGAGPPRRLVPSPTPRSRARGAKPHGPCSVHHPADSGLG